MDNKIINKTSDNHCTNCNIIGKKNVIGGCAADNESIEIKERKSIDFLRSIARYQPLFLAYSGGKDSEVLLHLAKKAGIEYTPFYNSTTIDRPGTISWVKRHEDVMILQPKQSFFNIIEHRGLPSTFQRFCCAKLKERFVATHVMTGVRRAESKKRTDRYQEPEMCRVYKTGQKGQIYMPILYWTNEDLITYIQQENIQCHPYYYEPDGTFHPERRLGCLGCPLAYDHGRKDFLRYPVLVRAWCRSLAIYRNTRPELNKSLQYFNDEYENFYHNLFHHSLKELQLKREQPNGFNPRQELQDYFKVSLPPPQSKLEDIKARLKQH